jgi:hypothetical protein
MEDRVTELQNDARFYMDLLAAMDKLSDKNILGNELKEWATMNLDITLKELMELLPCQED